MALNQKIVKLMKSTLKRMSIAISLSVAIVLSSCTTTMSGEQKKESRNVEDFNAIELSIAADVYLTQGEGYSFTIEGDKDYLEKVVTEVRGNTLVIKTENWVSFGFSNLEVKVYITMPEVEGLSISGSGDIKAVTPINAHDLTIKISGSGDVLIPQLAINSLSASISGSGDVEVSGEGSSTSAKVRITGSGDVSLKGIRFQDADISISGSGDTFLHATENLNARVVGSGDIVYAGNPLVDAKVSGSGTIKNK